MREAEKAEADSDDDVAILSTPPEPPSKLRKLREASVSPRKQKAPARSPTRAPKSPTKAKRKSKSPKKVRKATAVETSTAPPFVPSPKKAPAPAPSAASPAPAAAAATTSPAKSAGGAANWRQFQNRGPPKALGSKEVPRGAENCLLNKRFIITGVLESLEREEATRLIQDHGGTVMKSIGVHLNYAVVGDAPGPGKMKKIDARNAMAEKSKHITILNEDSLFELIRTSPAQQLTEKQKKALAKKNAPAKVTVAKPAAAAAGQGGPPGSGGESQLWTDKYKPATGGDLVGNPGAIKQVRAFLAKWKAGRVGPKDKRALLISGDPGIGKTSAALLVSKEMGFETVEFNASDTRSRKAIDLHIASLLGNRTITSMFAAKRPAAGAAETKKNKVLIMDEVDGMSGSDRGGIAELIKLIKTTRTPIICICNDRQSTKIRSLRTYCEQISWRKITAQQAVPRLLGIAKNEGLDISAELAFKIATLANGDMRQMLNSLQMFRVSKKHMHSSDIERMEKKQTTVGVFECIPQLLGQNTQQRATMAEKLDLYFVDMSLTPLFMQENYIKATPAVVQSLRSRPVPGGRVHPAQVALRQHLQCLASAAESISDGDLVDEATRRNQAWGLIPYHGVLSTVRPGWAMQGGLGAMQAFPSWLGKFSITRKHERLLTDVRTRMAAVTRADLPATLLEYMPLMRRALVNPLLRQDTERVPELFDLMQTYNLTKDDWDSIMAVTKLSNMTRDPFAWIPEKTLKEFGKMYTRAHYKEKDGFTKKKAVADKAPVLDEFGDLVTADTDEDTDSEAPGSDKLIKMKKPRKKRAPAKSKAKAKPKAKPKAKAKS